jgi:hypothetical protein
LYSFICSRNLQEKSTYEQFMIIFFTFFFKSVGGRWFLNINRYIRNARKKKKARLRYDNIFRTAWTDEFHFIKHSRKGNKFAFCEFCRTDFSINHGGHSDVTKHVGTAKHKGNSKDVQLSRSLAMFLPGNSKSSTLLDVFSIALNQFQIFFYIFFLNR